MAKHGLWIGALMGLLAMILGSFGAHGLESLYSDLEQNEWAKKLEVWHIADRYLMYHALITFVVGMMGQFNRHAILRWCVYCFVGGSAVFSGSLYLFALTNFSWLGHVAPLGGITLIVGWAMLALAGWQAVQPKKKKK